MPLAPPGMSQESSCGSVSDSQVTSCCRVDLAAAAQAAQMVSSITRAYSRPFFHWRVIHLHSVGLVFGHDAWDQRVELLRANRDVREGNHACHVDGGLWGLREHVLEQFVGIRLNGGNGKLLPAVICACMSRMQVCVRASTQLDGSEVRTQVNCYKIRRSRACGYALVKDFVDLVEPPTRVALVMDPLLRDVRRSGLEGPHCAHIVPCL